MFKLKIETKGSAFHNDCNGTDMDEEIKRILTEDVIPRIGRAGSGCTIHDKNGNRVGEWTLNNR